MNFIPFSDFDGDRLRAVLAECGARLCDFSYISLFMWEDVYQTAVAEDAGLFFIRAADPESGREFYVIPHMGDRLKEAVLRLSRHTGTPFFVEGVSEEALLTLKEAFGDRMTYTSLDAESDYLYEIADLASYAGRRYSQKRNHVNAFLREHAGAVYEPIDGGNLAAVRAFFRDYRATEEKESAAAHTEGAAAEEVLARFRELRAEGGLLREGDRILGFFVGEVVGDTLFLHIEKATRTVRGAYPYLVMCAARAYLARGVRYENREEDDGDEGLRQSKHSYNPVALLRKYDVTIG